MNKQKITSSRTKRAKINDCVKLSHKQVGWASEGAFPKREFSAQNNLLQMNRVLDHPSHTSSVGDDQLLWLKHTWKRAPQVAPPTLFSIELPESGGDECVSWSNELSCLPSSLSHSPSLVPRRLLGQAAIEHLHSEGPNRDKVLRKNEDNEKDMILPGKKLLRLFIIHFSPKRGGDRSMRAKYEKMTQTRVRDRPGRLKIPNRVLNWWSCHDEEPRVHYLPSG